MLLMSCQAGMIVRVNAGRGAGRFLLVTAVDGKDLFLADGEGIKLSKPKRKNPKHVQATKQIVPLDGLTDAALRKVLALMQPEHIAQSRLNETRKEVTEDVEAGCH